MEKRRYFCQREVALNKRFAANLYETVVSVTQSGKTLSFDGDGIPQEYAVRMKQFDEKSLFTELLKERKLTPKLLIDTTRNIALFHRQAELKPTYWSYAQVHQMISDNINTSSDHSPIILNQDVLSALTDEITRELIAHKKVIEERRSGSVKALHGDLHLRNLALFNGHPVLFDGIEFNDQLSCCDVWPDIAFLVMDLTYRQQPHLANIVTNTYLEESDDFQGLSLLKLYISYRAQVRVKVSCLEFENVSDEDQKEHARQSAVLHSKLALDTLKPSQPFIIAIGGLSGSGKTTIARALAPIADALQIRSDVIRKHLLGLNATAPAGEEGYTTEMNKRVYHEMLPGAKAEDNHFQLSVLSPHHSVTEASALVHQRQLALSTHSHRPLDPYHSRHTRPQRRLLRL